MWAELAIRAGAYIVAFALVWWMTQALWAWHYRRMDRLWDEAFKRVWPESADPAGGDE